MLKCIYIQNDIHVKRFTYNCVRIYNSVYPSLKYNVLIIYHIINNYHLSTHKSITLTLYS